MYLSENFDIVVYAICFILWSTMDSHFSNSPLDFGSGFTSPVVVAGGAKSKKNQKVYEIRNYNSSAPNILNPQSKVNRLLSAGSLQSFCIYHEVEEDGRVEVGLKLHVHRNEEREKK